MSRVVYSELGYYYYLQLEEKEALCLAFVYLCGIN